LIGFTVRRPSCLLYLVRAQLTGEQSILRIISRLYSQSLQDPECYFGKNRRRYISSIILAARLVD
jgi:hypothetical protein